MVHVVSTIAFNHIYSFIYSFDFPEVDDVTIALFFRQKNVLESNLVIVLFILICFMYNSLTTGIYFWKHWMKTCFMWSCCWST